MEDCIFCKIVNKEIDAHIVYEDDNVLAFLDNNPISLGHVLIVPKKHFVNIYDIEDDSLKEVVVAAKKIALIYKEVFGITNLNLLHNAGKNGQQIVFHLHFHLIPRKEGDDVDFDNKKFPELKEKYVEFIEKLSRKVARF